LQIFNFKIKLYYNAEEQSCTDKAPLFRTRLWSGASFLPLRVDVVKHGAGEESQNGSLNRQPGVDEIERRLELGSLDLEVCDHGRKGDGAHSHPVLGQGIGLSLLLGDIGAVLLDGGPADVGHFVALQ